MSTNHKNMKKNILLACGLLVVAAVVYANTINTRETKALAGYDIGDEAMDFKLKNIDGKMVSLADYNDAKGFIVVFTCNTCPYSKMYEQRIEDLNQMYASKGYPVIAINPNDKQRQPGDSFDEMIKRAGEKNFTFPYLYDETQEIATAYGATRTPHVYILSKNSSSKLKVEYIGAIDNNAKSGADASDKYVEAAVNSLLEGGKVDNSFTKAVGCTIKWKQS